MTPARPVRSLAASRPRATTGSTRVVRLPEPARVLRALAAAMVILAPVPRAAVAFAEVGTKLELVGVAGAKASVLVFFRADQDRSVDALRRLVACQKELAGKGVRWVGVVSGTASPPEVKAAISSTGIQLTVVVDEGDKLYDKVGIRMYPAVAIADANGVVRAMEPYRQLDFSDVVKAQIRFVLGEIDKAALDRALNPEASHLPGEGDPAKKAMRDVNMARRLIELGQYEAAVKQAQKALEQAPVPAAIPVLANAYARLGRCAEASRLLDQASKSGPESAEIAAARALCAGK